MDDYLPFSAASPSSPSIFAVSPPVVRSSGATDVLLPAPIVPSSPVVDTFRQASPALSTAWGWEPDAACAEARAWWEQWGLKPFQSASPGHSTTVGEDDDDDDELEEDALDTDVEEDDEDEEMMVAHGGARKPEAELVKEVEVLMSPRMVPSMPISPERVVIKSQIKSQPPSPPVIGVKRKLTIGDLEF